MKKRKQGALLWLLSALLCLTLCIPAGAAGTTGALLFVENGGAARGETFAMAVTLAGGAGVWGGNLDVTYDPAALTLVSVEAGELLSGALFQCNPNYTDHSARVSFAASAALEGDGTVCVLTFRVREEAPLTDTRVSLENARLYDNNAEACAVTTVSGQAAVWYSGLAVRSVEAVRGQSVRVALDLTGELDPAGGSFTIVYDPDQMTAGTVVASSLLKGYSLVSNETTKGRIQVTWAGTYPLKERGTLCTITFHISQEAVGDPEIGVENLRAYDENATALDTVAQGGSVTLLTPTEDSPKLWLVGGAIDPENLTASVNVVLEGRGVICGGQFTLTYPTDRCTLISHQIQMGSGVVNDETAGRLVVSWADATPAAESQVLLHLEFQVDAVSAVSLELAQATMLKSDGAAVSNVDIRNGKLLPGSLIYQAPAVDSAEVTVNGAGTAVEAVLDLASAQDLTALVSYSAEDAPSLLVAFYEDGRMKTLSRQEFSVEMDKNGIAQITVSASCAGTADRFRVFLLGEGGTLLPLAEDTWYDLEVSAS